MKNFFGFLTRVRSLEPSRATLYLELRGNELRAFHIPDVAWINLPLPDRTIINGIIFKPAALARAITDYLAAHHLVSPQTLVSFSTLAAPATPTRLFAVFSLALALKRVPLSLTKVVAPPASDALSPATLEATLEAFERLPDELAPFRPPAGRSSTGWLFTSATLIALGVTVGGVVHWRTYHDVRALGRAVDDLQSTVNQDQVKVKNLAALTRETGALESLVAQATKVQASTNNCLTLLNTLSQQLPKNLLITSINIERVASSAKGVASTLPSVLVHGKKNTKKNQPVLHNQAAHKSSVLRYARGACPEPVEVARTQDERGLLNKSVTVIIQGTSTTSSSVSRFLQTLGEPGSGVTAPVLTTLGHIKKAHKNGATAPHPSTSSGRAGLFYATRPADQQASDNTRRYHFIITGQLEG